MRSRGCLVTDIAVLVIAAEDGIMEQTIESIKYATQAKVPIIVAINKIDKPEANIKKVKQDLAGYGLTIEEFGGDVQIVPISALKGTNIAQLLEAILAEAEILDLKADYDGFVEGTIIEAKIDKHRGILSTAIISRGTLQKGNILISIPENEIEKSEMKSPDETDSQRTPSNNMENVSVPAFCKVRALFNHDGRPVPKGHVTPGYPVQILGWKSMPQVGHRIYQVQNEARANAIIAYRTELSNTQKSEDDWKITEQHRQAHLINYHKDLEMKRALKYKKLPKSYSHQNYEISKKQEAVMIANEKPSLSIVIKADVIGSIEAILDILESFDDSVNHCSLNVLHFGVGPVTDFDIGIAQTFKGIIYTFNINEKPALIHDQSSKNPLPVVIKNHRIIYKLLDDVVVEMTKILPLLDRDEVVGIASVTEEFVVTENKKTRIPVAGCTVDSGVISKKCDLVHVIRKHQIVGKSKIKSIKHFKMDVDTTKKGNECGIALEDSTIRYQPGDTLNCINILKYRPTIEWNMGFQTSPI